MVDQPHRHLRDLRRKLFNLNAVKLVDIQRNHRMHIKSFHPFFGNAQNFQFQQTQLAVGNHQKITAAASRVEKLQGAEFFMKLKEFVSVLFYFFKLGA